MFDHTYATAEKYLRNIDTVTETAPYKPKKDKIYQKMV